jgi:hypothetical protein
MQLQHNSGWRPGLSTPFTLVGLFLFLVDLLYLSKKLKTKSAKLKARLKSHILSAPHPRALFPPLGAKRAVASSSAGHMAGSTAHCRQIWTVLCVDLIDLQTRADTVKTAAYTFSHRKRAPLTCRLSQWKLGVSSKCCRMRLGVQTSTFMPVMRCASDTMSFPPITRPAEKECLQPTTRSTSNIWRASSRVGEMTSPPSPSKFPHWERKSFSSTYPALWQMSRRHISSAHADKRKSFSMHCGR